MLQRTLPAGFIAPCLPTKTDKLPSGLNADKRMRVRWRQSWGDVFDLLLKDRDLLLLLIIAVLGALIGIAALFGVLIYALR